MENLGRVKNKGFDLIYFNKENNHKLRGIKGKADQYLLKTVQIDSFKIKG